MELSNLFNMATLVVAIFAFWLSYRESRRNNSVILKLVGCKFNRVADFQINGHDLIHILRFTIRNQGIPIHDLSVELRFADQGEYLIPLLMEKKSITGIPDKNGMAESMPLFARGMIAQVSIAIYSDDDAHSPHFLVPITDEIKVSLQIRSQGFLIAEFEFNGKIQQMKQWWNRKAVSFNLKKNLRPDWESPRLRYRGGLPMFADYRTEVRMFVDSLLKRRG